MFFIHVSHSDDEYSLGQCGRAKKIDDLWWYWGDKTLLAKCKITKESRHWKFGPAKKPAIQQCIKDVIKNVTIQKKGVVENIDLQNMQQCKKKSLQMWTCEKCSNAKIRKRRLWKCGSEKNATMQKCKKMCRLKCGPLKMLWCKNA